ncbi:MAG: DEAD/DEAH box helicase [Candidatus Omnitrophica bacterium]|nr:DEAD/DEAH box helicase [Candidatus Omnitrophota bacterium]
MNRELAIVVLPNKYLQAEWFEVDSDISKSQALLERDLYKRFASDFDSALLFLAFCDKTSPLSVTLNFWRDFASIFAEKLIHTPEAERLRHRINLPLRSEEADEILNSAPLMSGAEYLDKTVLFSLWDKLNLKFQKEIKAWKGSVEDFIKKFSPNVHLVGRVYFHLVENKKDEDYPFAFLATYSTGLTDHGKSKHLPLKYALEEYGKDSKKLLVLLSTVSLAAKESAVIHELLESGELFHPLTWEAKHAFEFLKKIPVYEKCGILCRIPDWWKAGSSGLKMDIRIGDVRPSHVGMETILNPDIRLCLGEDEISIEEAGRLLREAEGLAYIKNKWVTVDPQKLKQTLEAYEKVREMMGEGGLSLRDALRLQLNPGRMLNLDDKAESIGVSNGQWLESVIHKLRNPDAIASCHQGEGFKAKLRDYQKKGLNWLNFLHSLQFGACLADDMGLGKTVQVLAFLNKLKSSVKPKTSLLVIPASLLGNWISEIKRFAPNIKIFTAHPALNQNKTIKPQDKGFLDKLDMVITTYSLIQRYQWIKDYSWGYVILDEAQAIKNPGTKQTKAVKKLKSQNRIIMTGTPIENRISDLWSLFDFINPGLLGNANEFNNFLKGLKDGHDGYSRLRKIISPYILRRLKTDKAVISDLPEKIEMKTYAMLSKRQVVLYKNMVDELKEIIEAVEGINRKGVVLASIMKFKQLCNHPDQYLGTGKYAEAESGKFIRLREICETIYGKREKMLVFTQFKEITEPLKEFLETVFEREGLILHGSIPVKKRKEIINRFQSKEYVPFMVLSLKAGGVGLNLTEANHVLHFDRWWNPAVEDQATDRTFRIGQKKNVIVHKFITRGTIEEKIDAMLEEKKQLSDEIIKSNAGSWITEMNNKDLINLFKLD